MIDGNQSKTPESQLEQTKTGSEKPSLTASQIGGMDNPSSLFSHLKVGSAASSDARSATSGDNSTKPSFEACNPELGHKKPAEGTIKNPDGTSSTVKYDKNGGWTEGNSGANGKPIEQTKYGADGMPTEQTKYGPDGKTPTEHTKYGPDGKPSEQTKYGPDGKTPTEQTKYGPDGKPTEATKYGPDGKTPTEHTKYGPDGKPTEATKYGEDGKTPTEQTKYGADGKPTEQTKYGADGKTPTEQTKYGPDGKTPTEHTTWNKDGTHTCDRFGPDGSTRTEETKFDDKTNKAIEQTKYGSDGKTPTERTKFNNDGTKDCAKYGPDGKPTEVIKYGPDDKRMAETKIDSNGMPTYTVEFNNNGSPARIIEMGKEEGGKNKVLELPPNSHDFKWDDKGNPTYKNNENVTVTLGEGLKPSKYESQSPDGKNHFIMDTTDGGKTWHYFQPPSGQRVGISEPTQGVDGKVHATQYSNGGWADGTTHTLDHTGEQTGPNAAVAMVQDIAWAAAVSVASVYAGAAFASPLSDFLASKAVEKAAEIIRETGAEPRKPEEPAAAKPGDPAGVNPQKSPEQAPANDPPVEPGKPHEKTTPNPDGSSTTTKYDENGNPTEQTKFDHGKPSEQTKWDQNGKPSEKTTWDQQGNKTCDKYGPDGKPSEQYVWDAQGHKTSESRFAKDGTSSTAIFDKQGNVTEVVHGSAPDYTPDHSQAVEQPNSDFHWDKDGHAVYKHDKVEVTIGSDGYPQKYTAPDGTSVERHPDDAAKGGDPNQWWVHDPKHNSSEWVKIGSEVPNFSYIKALLRMGAD